LGELLGLEFLHFSGTRFFSDAALVVVHVPDFRAFPLEKGVFVFHGVKKLVQILVQVKRVNGQ